MNAKRMYQQPECSIANCELNNTILTGVSLYSIHKPLDPAVDSSWENIIYN